MSPGCNPLFLLLLLGAPSSSKSSSLIGAALCCAALLERLIFGPLQHTTQHHITQPGPSERSRAPLSLQSFHSCLHHFLFTLRNEAFCRSPFFFFCRSTEPGAACWENGLGWINIFAQTLKDTVYVLRFYFLCKQEQRYHIYYVFFFLEAGVLYRLQIKTAGANVNNTGIHFGLYCTHCG